jgi:hypothetical protein
MVRAPKFMVKNMDHKLRGGSLVYGQRPKVYGNIDQSMVKNIDHKLDLLDHKVRDVPKFTAKILTINLIFFDHKLRDVPKFTAKH